MKKIVFLLFFAVTLLAAQAQNLLVSGPWAGNVQIRTASVWAEVSPAAKAVSVKFWPKGKIAQAKTVLYKQALGNDFNPVKFDLNGLDFNTTYEYQLQINNKPATTKFATQFTTQDLWQWRKPAPNFSFLAGSCAYVNEPVFDRPGKPYGADSSIFETMANIDAKFHLWMGDSWYTREVDFGSAWGLNYRASRDRSMPFYQKFMASMPQYFIWDDHDFGPNDAGLAYIFKDDSRNIFKNYTLNPTYGSNNKGIYTQMSYGDVDVFLTDDRYFRTEIDMEDSVDGKPNPDKHFFGNEQIEWLQNALLFSRANFKIIVVGSQVLNPLNNFECMRSYSHDYNQVVNFISQYKIPGVMFFTGDRHHSEVVKMEQPNMYTMYDVTISPYTSGISKVRDAELTNPYRIANTLVEAQNFGKISVTGEKASRTLTVEFLGIKGEVLGSWSVKANDLKIKK
jgi:alkaline phosphatase D